MVLQCIIHELLARCFIGTEIGDALNLGFNAEKNSCYITNNNVMAEEIDKGRFLLNYKGNLKRQLLLIHGFIIYAFLLCTEPI